MSLVEEKLIETAEGKVLVRNHFLSLDPYMRGRMNDSKSYAAPAKIGEPMTGETAGIVIESNSDLFNVGDKVLFGKWSGTEVKIDGKEYSIMKESDIMGITKSK